MKQILIQHPIKLRSMIQHAARIGAEAELGAALLRLLHMLTSGMVEDTTDETAPFKETEGDQVAVISDDFAPHSLRFYVVAGNASAPSQWQRGGGFWNGGFIYEGPGCPSDGSAPSLTVSLNSNPHKPSWSIHT